MKAYSVDVMFNYGGFGYIVTANSEEEAFKICHKHVCDGWSRIERDITKYHRTPDGEYESHETDDSRFTCFNIAEFNLDLSNSSITFIGGYEE